MTDALDVVDALEAIDADRDVARLTGAAPPDVGEEAQLLERLADLIVPDRVAASYRAAVGSSDSVSTEAARRHLRAIAPRFLGRAALEPESELAERRAFPATPVIGFEATVASGECAAARDESFGRWIELERALAAAEDARASAREQAARRAGAKGTTRLLAATQAVSPDAVATAFERVVVAPLDESVGRAASLYWSRWARPAETRFPADAPRMHYLIDHGSWLPREGILAVLRRLEAELRGGEGAPLTIRQADGAGLQAEWRIAGEGRGWLGVGPCPGPAALRSALGALGAASRGGFIAATRGSLAARFADPVFAVAAHVLFARLVSCSRFREAAGIPENPSAIAAVALHEAVATRVGWVYLQTVLANVDAHSDAFERGIERATGGPVTPAHRERVRDRDPSTASTLRGTVLGLLLEERLRSRFGRAWFRSPRARAWLRSMWEAEPDLAPDAMAAAAELGELEPTPVLDATRAALRG